MKTVFVGLSGGVDSAVSAAILKEQGYNVVGAFIKIWRPEFIDCPWQKDRLDAMRVCAHLGIPFKEIDLSDEYKKTVIDDMVENYAKGVTPNPDVLCNRHIKFGAFLKWALENGADKIATGHYARIEEKEGKYTLLRGKDRNKDQSYFLWRLTQEDLAKILFPVGHLTKPEVRALAEKYGLPVAKKHDSQGLCFVGDISMREFLSHYLPMKKGKVLDENKKTIGEHDGAALYTPGERRGFRVAARNSEETPFYVIAVDTSQNTVSVSRDKTKAYRDSARLTDTNWFIKNEGTTLKAQARYRENPIACTIQGPDVAFVEPHLAPSGQSLVIYEGERLVGGGVIT